MSENPDHFQAVFHKLDEIDNRLTRFEQLLHQLLAGDQEWFTPKEVADLLGKQPYTVREWCRFGRLKAQKLQGGRGNEGEWRIHRDELSRYHREGLLPPPRWCK